MALQSVDFAELRLAIFGFGALVVEHQSRTGFFSLVFWSFSEATGMPLPPT
jgi:hypothetical protein